MAMEVVALAQLFFFLLQKSVIQKISRLLTKKDPEMVLICYHFIDISCSAVHVWLKAVILR